MLFNAHLSKFTRSATLISIFLLSCFHICFSQDKSTSLDKIKINNIYLVSIEFNANMYEGGCQTTGSKYTVLRLSKVRVEQKDTVNKKIVFQITQGYQGDSSRFAKVHKLYCVNLDDFGLSIDTIKVKARTKLDYGFLTIPFKFQYSNYVIHPGGSLGGFIGPRFVSAKDSDKGFSLIGFAGLSSVPLNNNISTTNASDIKVVPGLGLGLGGVFSVKSFQLGLITGWDFYNNDGPKTNSWLSLSIGYTFLRPDPDEKQ